MIKPWNQRVLAIVMFEVFLGTGTTEWVSTWIEDFKSEIWVAFGVYAVLLFGLGFLFIHASKHIGTDFSGCTLLDSICGRKFGGVLNTLLLGALLVYAGKTMLLGVSLIHYATLPYTPRLTLIVFGLLVSVQLLYGGVNALMRFQTVIFLPNIVLTIMLLALCIRTFDFSNLLPISPTASELVQHSIPRFAELLPGIILLAVFLPLMRRQDVCIRDIQRGFLYAWIGVVTLNLLNLLIVLTNYGPFEASMLQWPVLEAVRQQKIPALFLARLDLILLLPILTAVISAVNLFSYGAYHILSYYFPAHKRIAVICVCLSIVLLSNIHTHAAQAIDMYGLIVTVCELVLIFVAPIRYAIPQAVLTERRIRR